MRDENYREEGGMMHSPGDRGVRCLVSQRQMRRTFLEIDSAPSQGWRGDNAPFTTTERLRIATRDIEEMPRMMEGDGSSLPGTKVHSAPSFRDKGG